MVGAIISALIAVMNSVSTMTVRDFVMHFRPHITEKTQVRVGRLAILISAALGTGAAYVVYKQPEGIYKYLLTISVYLVMPIAPAIVFGIMSKRVTFAGAAASVFAGLALAAAYIVDSCMPPATAEHCLPWLHYPLTLNYTYRGAWGALVLTAVLFLVSAFTKKTDPEKLAKTTMDWSNRPEPFRGLSDWRLHLAVLLAATAAIYYGFGRG